MKNYITRLREGCSTRTFIFWWIFRILMIYAFVAGFFKKPFDITDPLQVGANFLCMFVWEVFMLFPEKSTFRFVTPGFQSVFIPGIFAASFGGKFLNLYYDSRFLDSFLHFTGSVICVYFGYELACALIKREKKNASLNMILFAAIGFSFIGSTLWEAFEFVFDQVAGMMGEYPGDAQHWSFLLAEGTPKEQTLFDPLVPERWAIMDIMGDMILNIAGAAVGFIAIHIYPYRHKGKYKFDFDFDSKVQTKEVETAKAK